MAGRLSRLLVVAVLLVGVLFFARPGFGGFATAAGPRGERVLAFAQDGAAYAWVTAPRNDRRYADAPGRCTAHVRASASAQTVVAVVPPLDSYCPFPLQDGKLVLFHGSLLWLEEPPAIHYNSDLNEWTPGKRPHRLYSTEQDDLSLKGSYISALDAGGGTVAAAVVDVEPGNCSTKLNRCDGRVAGGALLVLGSTPQKRSTPRWLPGSVAASLISVAGPRIALVPAPDDATTRWSKASASVEVRNQTGEQLWLADTTAPVDELAASTTIVAALMRTSAQSSSIAVYDAATGQLLQTVAVPPSASDLGASGNRVIYRTGRLIRLLGRGNPIAVASGDPVGLSISGNRVGWGDATGIHFARVP